MTTDIAPYTPQEPQEYRARFVMAPDEARALDQQLRDSMRAVLVENTDYGLIPGMGSKPSLFKPGAEKLLQWFGFGFRNDRGDTERDPDGQRIGVTYECTVFKELGDGRKITVATCEGYAGYDEERFCRPAKGSRPEYRAPWNTVLKMAQKRALVGAAIDATAAAGLFTQDLEDMKPAAPDAGFTEAAQAAIMALDDGTRAAVDQWYRNKKWPDPGRWTPEQWCSALVMAGAFSTADASPAPPAAPHAGQTPGTPSTAKRAGEAPDPALAPPDVGADGAGAVPGDSDYDIPGTATEPMLKAIWTVLGKVYGFTSDEKDKARKVCAHIVQHDLATSSNLSYNEAKTVLDTLGNWQAVAREHKTPPRKFLDTILSDAAAGEARDGE